MRLLDLFCGRFGWSRAFAARGWTCTGVDLVRPPEIPENCFFHELDILEIFDVVQFSGPDFICASSPCEQFSVHGMKHFHPNPPYPELGIKLFNHTREICEASGVPYVMENVRAAQQFVGKARDCYGSRFLWGSAVPSLMKARLPRPKSKGATQMRRDGRFKRAGGVDELMYQNKIERAAKLATIPPELASCVADYAERLLEQVPA